MLKHHINIFIARKTRVFITDVPDLRGCLVFGETLKEAVKEVMIGIGLWIDAAKSTEKEIPQPKYKPVIYRV